MEETPPAPRSRKSVWYLKILLALDLDVALVLRVVVGLVAEQDRASLQLVIHSLAGVVLESGE